jgi:hypothetical protein
MDSSPVSRSPTTRRSVSVLIAILVVIAAGVVWYRARGASGTADDPRAGAASGTASAAGAAPAAGSSQAGLAGAPPGTRSPTARGEARAKRDALREQIARQLASRPAPDEAGRGSAASPRPPTDPRPRGNLRNNLGGRDALVAHLNEEFMPLASECIEQAEARSPRLSGMLAIGLETIADEELGAVVDAADPTPTNNVVDPLLFECIRESALSLTLPPPLTSGREKFELTLPVGPRSGSGAPR